MASYPETPVKFFRIDEKNRSEYSYLQPQDLVFYIWEYPTKVWESCGGSVPYRELPTYDFINNFQIKVGNTRRWKYKQAAIEHAAAVLRKLIPELIPDDWLTRTTFVPMPPSRIRTDPGYDSRLLDTLKSVGSSLDVRESLFMNRNVEQKGKGISPEERALNLSVDREAISSCREHIFVFDDVLTTGSHYKAAELTLRKHIPDVHIYGLYLTRAVRPVA